MARGTIEHHNQAMVGIHLAEAFQECLETGAVQARQTKAKTLACCRIYCGVEVGPLIGAVHDVRRAKPLGTVALLVPVDQSEACLIEGQNLQWLLLEEPLVFSPEVLGEVFLKCSCSSGLALRWRGRPLLSFTWRRLKS